MLKGLQKLLRLDLGEAIPAKGLAVDEAPYVTSRRIRLQFFPNDGIWVFPKMVVPNNHWFSY